MCLDKKMCIVIYNNCLINTDATVAFLESVYSVNEGDGSVTMCTEINDIPMGGLECDVVVNLVPTKGVKAGM